MTLARISHFGIRQDTFVISLGVIMAGVIMLSVVKLNILILSADMICLVVPTGCVLLEMGTLRCSSSVGEEIFVWL
jgi:hypothetical protein